MPFFTVKKRREQQQQSESANATYELVYFDTRGAAEPIRLLLSLAGVPWGDLRYPMGVSGSGFSLSDSYCSDRDAGTFAINMNALPVLKVLKSDGTVIHELGQSHAIARYLAHHHDLMGANPVEAALVDNLYECVRDVKSAWFKIKATKDGLDSPNARRDAKERWFSLELSEWCLKLEGAARSIANNLNGSPGDAVKAAGGANDVSSPWLVGSRLSLADVATYHLLGTPTSIASGSTVSFFDGEGERVRAAYMGHCPRLAACIAAVGALPRIRSWEEQRPDTFS